MPVRRQKIGAIAVGVLAVLFLHTPGTRASMPQQKANRIVVHKSERTMTLFRDGKVLKAYKVALSTDPVGPKEREGDHKVPEGLYVVDAKNAHSKFHLALHISYPNAADRERARKPGVKLGGNIEIHGLGPNFGWVGSLHRQVDWTDGCIAVTNSEIEEIWPLVPVGTAVEILP
ncbi:MAG: L,D-transpeptidase family protein [Candidatus Acidiferrum sp.]